MRVIINQEEQGFWGTVLIKTARNPRLDLNSMEWNDSLRLKLLVWTEVGSFEKEFTTEIQLKTVKKTKNKV